MATTASQQLAWRQSRSKRMQIAAIATVGYPLIRVLGATYRWRVEGLEHYEAVLRSDKRPIMAFWHGRILPATLYFQHRGIVVVASENFDGEWIGRIITRFGYGRARGSSSRGGARALVELKRLMREGRSAAFTLDGPRGPARVAQPGAVFLSKITGNPIVPFHIEAKRHWTLGSWDATQVPKPGSLVSLVIGEPYVVPRDVDDDGLEAWRTDLEKRLGRLEARAHDLLG